jgi:hypothetical protein
VILALAAALLVVALPPAAATAAITATSARLDGVTGTSAPPGSVIPAKVTANVSSATGRATDVAFGSARGTCADHGKSGSGTGVTESFDVTAPGSPGDYDVDFTPNEADACDGTAGNPYTLTDGLRVTTPGPNPNLSPHWGIDVMLVLDKSGLIDSSGATEDVRQATRAFLAALSGTGAAASITDFSSTAQQRWTTRRSRATRSPTSSTPISSTNTSPAVTPTGRTRSTSSRGRTRRDARTWSSSSPTATRRRATTRPTRPTPSPGSQGAVGRDAPGRR